MNKKWLKNRGLKLQFALYRISHCNLVTIQKFIVKREIIHAKNFASAKAAFFPVHAFTCSAFASAIERWMREIYERIHWNNSVKR